MEFKIKKLGEGGWSDTAAILGYCAFIVVMLAGLALITVVPWALGIAQMWRSAFG